MLFVAFFYGFWWYSVVWVVLSGGLMSEALVG